MEEEFFGDPQTLLNLAGAFAQTSQVLWQLQQALNDQVTALVPSIWDGRAATAFKAHWEKRDNDIRQAAELARRLQNSVGRLGTELAAAKAQFLVGKGIANANGIVIFYTGVGFFAYIPNYPPSPNQVAALPAVQADVQTAWAQASKAWLQAHGELAIDTLPILGGLKDLLLAPVRALGDFADMGIGAADFMGRLTTGDLSGAWHDVESAAAAVGHTLKVIGQGAWWVVRTSAELDPDSYATTEEFLKRQDEIGREMNARIKEVLDRPGNFITGTATLGIEVFGPGAIAKALRLGAVADAAAFEREAAAADAATNTSRWGWTGRVGEANEAAALKQLEQRGETAVNLNTIKSNFQGYDLSSNETFYQARARGTMDAADNISQGRLDAYRRDFSALTNPESAANRGLAADLLNPDNADGIRAMQQQGAWPRGLPTDADAAQIQQFGARNGVLTIPDNQVGPVRDMLRGAITEDPARFGLPAGTTPTEPQIQGLLDRVRPSGITTDGINRVAPPDNPSIIPTPVFPAPTPGGGITVPPLPITPSPNPVLPAPAPASSQ